MTFHTQGVSYKKKKKVKPNSFLLLSLIMPSRLLRFRILKLSSLTHLVGLFDGGSTHCKAYANTTKHNIEKSRHMGLETATRVREPWTLSASQYWR